MLGRKVYLNLSLHKAGKEGLSQFPFTMLGRKVYLNLPLHNAGKDGISQYPSPKFWEGRYISISLSIMLGRKVYLNLSLPKAERKVFLNFPLHNAGKEGLSQSPSPQRWEGRPYFHPLSTMLGMKVYLNLLISISLC